MFSSFITLTMSAPSSFSRMWQRSAIMHAPLVGMVVGIVTQDVEERALVTAETPPSFWKCHVDDTCTALPSYRIDEFLNHLNSVELSIQLTVEIEPSGRLPFLDVLLGHEEDGSISTTKYRKLTHIDRYLDFSSHHPLAHKIVVVKDPSWQHKCHQFLTRTVRSGTLGRP